MNQDQYVQSIYDKAMIQRSKTEREQSQRVKEDMEKRFWEYLPKRLEILIEKVMNLYQNPNISKAQIDEAERGVSNLMNIVQTHTLPEVIEHLTRDLQKKEYVDRLK